MLFKRKQKLPLEEASALVQQAIEIAYTYLRDKSYQPTEANLALFEQLSQALWENHTTAQYIARCMGQRSRGEPEGAKKFTDPKVFDYHYPP